MKLSEKLSILTSDQENISEFLEESERHFGWCPEFYKEFVTEYGATELRWETYGYLRIWSPLTCIEMDEAYGIKKYFGECFPLGDDGGDFLAEVPNKGLFLVSYTNLSVDNSRFISRSLDNLLTRSEGLERIYDESSDV